MLSRPVPQPPATELVAAGLNLQLIVTEALIGMIAAVTSTSPPANEPPPAFIQARIDRAVSRISAYLAPLQAEIEQLKSEIAAYKASRERLHGWIREEQLKNVHLKARCDELEDLLRDINDAPGGSQFKKHIDAALSKPAAIEQA
ncbi:Uncharacterized protein ALO91_01418 [Pseudomonas syringae pv. aceris]|uniref:Uncharacterized protein n=2 Tax=Pseudomonas syringae TaxID=317 RepID=A0A0L8IIW6_PSESX|nr:Uncharacterized protein ABJ98_4589 [Pseudomonas syringae pv. aceris]KPW15354.1 Uncharacterized protein ALO91_01418 [Pseudomonas syringae pv. aceris]